MTRLCTATWDAIDARGDRIPIAACQLDRGHHGLHHATRIDGEPTHAQIRW